jgi:hypothetical protein
MVTTAAKVFLCGILAAGLFTPLSAGAEEMPKNAAVSGRVTRHAEGVAGARVFAYRSLDDFFARAPMAVSNESAEDGSYTLAVPPGFCYLVAEKGEAGERGTSTAASLSAYHGSNPFTLTAGEELEVDFSLAERKGEERRGESEEPGSGTLAGIVTWRGSPAEGVLVRLYLDAEGDFRGMGYASAPPTGADGRFRFDYLPESSYFLLARKRAGGGSAGPLGEGDLFGYFVGNPVSVATGSMVEVDFEVVSKGREKKGADSRPRVSGTSISGRIRDAAGEAVPGVYAFAYEEQVMAHKKPAFISSPAGEDGRYVIYLSRGGTWYIGARSAYGDSPAKGEWYGRYDGSADHGVTVTRGGALEGIDIVVEKVLP